MEQRDDIIYGRMPVMEAIKSSQIIDKIYIQNGNDKVIANIKNLAINAHIIVVNADKKKLDEMCGNALHQGVIALIPAKEYSSIDDILQIAKDRNQKPFILVCDGVQDSHNLGAIIRSAECFGVHGVVIPKRHSATLNGVVSKTSAGALEHMAIAKVTNISTTLDELKSKGLWIYGAEADGENIEKIEFAPARAIVVGSEGFGLSRLVREKCDYLVSIKMCGKINSLNVSCATAIILQQANCLTHFEKN